MSAVAIDISAHALAYAEQGWAVWPIRPCTKGIPYVAHGCRDATDDADTVAGWWRRWPWANIGALVPQGQVVCDIDPRNGGSLRLDLLPETLTVRTGGD